MHYIYYNHYFVFTPQVRRHIVHTMVGGGGQHGEFDALDYRKILQGNADKLGNYPSRYAQKYIIAVIAVIAIMKFVIIVIMQILFRHWHNNE